MRATKTTKTVRICSVVSLALVGLGCAGGASGGAPSSNGNVGAFTPGGGGGWTGTVGTTGTAGATGASVLGAAGAVATAPVSAGSFANVGTGGGQDFAAFRRAIAAGMIPSPSTLDAAGFFAEHYTSLPPPTCGQTFCLHGLLSISPDLARGGQWTLLQMGMNSSVDPATVAKPPLDLVVVLDRSGSMAAANKIDYAKQGIELLVDHLGDADTFTFIAFDDRVETLFGPARVADRAAIKAIVEGVGPRGGTNIYGGLEAGYKAALMNGDETQQRRVIFLTDGLPTAGVTGKGLIASMSAGYNDQHVGLTTIGLGADVDAGLLRDLSEQGGGNFYFVEQPAAVQEVFTQELAFFVAPIAYDLELTFGELPAYKVKEIYGTNLWRAQTGGGSVRIPSVFLVSRTSTMPDATGGRRGGGSAIIAELAANAGAIPGAGSCDVAKLHLSYRLPGSTKIETQDAAIAYDVGAVVTIGDEYYSSRDVEKNTIILGLYVALRDATALAQTDPRAASAALAAFLPKLNARLAGWDDEDLLSDVVVVQQYLTVLAARSPSP